MLDVSSFSARLRAPNKAKGLPSATLFLLYSNLFSKLVIIESKIIDVKLVLPSKYILLIVTKLDSKFNDIQIDI